MSIELTPASVSSRTWLDRSATMIASIVVIFLGVTTASAQGSLDRAMSDGSDDIDRLSSCAALYSIANRCYAREASETSRRRSAVAAQNEDKVVHLSYLYSKRVGTLPETINQSTLSAIARLLASMDNRCENINKPLSLLGPSCDRMIKDVPIQRYDDREERGDLGTYAPASVR